MLDQNSPPPFSFKQGTLPILVSIPHNGSLIPPEIAATMTEDGTSSRDTDWFLDRLYDFDELSQASKIISNYSRYVVDLNRPSNNQSLYPGQTTTGLIPETCFDGAKIYRDDPPSDVEIDQRIEKIWKPYHQQLENELSRIREAHSVAVLIEAHSIKSAVPRLFEGELPVFNIGTNQGKSCDESLANLILDVLNQQTEYSHIANGRFIGGYITRHFGNPVDNIHSVQIELSQKSYMNEDDLSWADDKADKVQVVFRNIVQAITQWIQNK